MNYQKPLTMEDIKNYQNYTKKTLNLSSFMASKLHILNSLVFLVPGIICDETELVYTEAQHMIKEASHG